MLFFAYCAVFLNIQACICVMGGLCSFHGTDCRSAALTAPLASSGPARREVVLHGGYGTSSLSAGEWGCTDL